MNKLVQILQCSRKGDVNLPVHGHEKGHILKKLFSIAVTVGTHPGSIQLDVKILHGPCIKLWYFY